MGKLLCWLGRHDWALVYAPMGCDSIFVHQCRRCSAIKEKS